MTTTPRSDLLSPDCRDEFKHRACSGDAWDDIEDRPAACECPCHEDELRGLEPLRDRHYDFGGSPQ